MKKFLVLLATLLCCEGISALETMEPLETIFQKFNFNLFTEMVDEKSNAFLSPFSVQIALSMMQNGANGGTLAQIQEVMGTVGYSVEEVNEFIKQLTEKITYRPPFTYNPYYYDSEEEARGEYDARYPVCELANGLWTVKGSSIKQAFYDVLTTCFDAEVGISDFESQEDIDSINAWVKKHTHNLIQSIVDEPNPNILLLLANVVYFKGNWAIPFDEYDTHPATFHQANGKSKEVSMMCVSDCFHRTVNSRFVAVKMPYGNHDYSMTLFLPQDEQEMPQLTYQDWVAAQTNDHKKDLVKVQMPSFSIEGQYDLVDVLRAKGMIDAFCPDADFSYFTDDMIYISQLYQLSKVMVDENGTEAAAVTVTVAPSMESPDEVYEDFICDRPFYFTIEHNVTNTVLFVGRVMDILNKADVPDGIVSPQVKQMRHTTGLYDLYGRRRSQSPQKGVYIVDGKKVVK